MNLKEQFLDAWQREFPTTLKVLKAFPSEKSHFKPHERSMAATELAWLFVQEQVVISDKRWTARSRCRQSFRQCRPIGEML